MASIAYRTRGAILRKDHGINEARARVVHSHNKADGALGDVSEREFGSH